MRDSRRRELGETLQKPMLRYLGGPRSHVVAFHHGGQFGCSAKILVRFARLKAGEVSRFKTRRGLVGELDQPM